MDTPFEQSPLRGFMDVVKDLQHEVAMLLRGEIALARAEIAEKSDTYRKSSIKVAVGGVIAYTGALMCLVGLACLLYRGFVGMGMHPTTALWMAPLLLGAVILIFGGVMLNKAIRTLKKEPLMPEKTISTLKEDKQWARKKVA